jgi:hypothetical protein
MAAIFAASSRSHITPGGRRGGPQAITSSGVTIRSTRKSCSVSGSVVHHLQRMQGGHDQRLSRQPTSLYEQGRPPEGEAVIGESQRLSDAEQLAILALLEAASTEDSAMCAARALAELMRHLHVLGQRIAGELPDQDRNRTTAVR